MQVKNMQHRDSETEVAFKDVNNSSVVSLSEIPTVRAYIDIAALSENNDLAIVGWLYDPDYQVKGFSLLLETQNGILKKNSFSAYPLEQDVDGVMISRTARPDVAKAMSSADSKDAKHGLVMVIPHCREGVKLALKMKDGRYAIIPFVSLNNPIEIKKELQNHWSHSGTELAYSVQAALGENNTLTKLISEMVGENVDGGVLHKFATCDHALLLRRQVLILHGWIAKSSADIEKVELNIDGDITDITAKISRYMRPDLFSDYPWSQDEMLGFLCALTDIPPTVEQLKIKITSIHGLVQQLSCKVDNLDWGSFGAYINDHALLATPLLNLLSNSGIFTEDAGRGTSRLTMLQRDSFMSRYPELPTMVENSSTVIAAVDRVYPLGKNGMLVTGWKLFPKRQPSAILVRNEMGDKVDITSRFTSLLRSDVAKMYRARFPSIDDRCGFVTLIPMPTRPGEARVLCFDFEELGEIWLKLPVSNEEKTGEYLINELIGLLPVAIYRDLLLEIGNTLGQGALFKNLIDEQDDEQLGRDPANAILFCEQSMVINGRALLLHGWIGLEQARISRLEILTPMGEVDITDRIVRTMRFDLANRFAWANDFPAGFVVVLEDAELLGQSLRMRVTGTAGERQLIKLAPFVCDWAGVANLTKHRLDMESVILDMLANTKHIESEPERLASRVSMLRREGFQIRYPNWGTMVDQPATVIASIDKAYPLGEAGLLIFGWWIMPKRKPLSISIINEAGQSFDISDRFTELLRADVAQNYRTRFPQIDDWCGFMCLAPLPTMAGEARALSFDFGALGKVFIKVATDKQDIIGIDLIKQMIGMVPAPELMRHKLYDLFNTGLGDAIEAVNKSRPQFNRKIEERQYGIPNEQVDISVIVPLYGRFDFLRHQLAQFASDKDFASVDLIYVVDDPKILSQTLELAARYQPLFRLPFRVVWYGENRGFAGANNIGAKLAKGNYLMLLNSDVIPQHAGWLSILRTGLDELKEAGAVGPLLQFADNSIQHAGMYPRREALLPGFLLNTHKCMGMAWAGGNYPSEHPMLTAACLMMRTSDYQALGGFDEGYVIGDFEDSDLCLALRQHHKRMWLIPEAKLWHLERQSQNMGDMVGPRQMITLFNGWRYNKKIKDGLLADPTILEVQE